MTRFALPSLRSLAGLATLALASLALAAGAARAEGHGGHGGSHGGGHGGAIGGGFSHGGGHIGGGHVGGGSTWFDGAHGHAHTYPAPGWGVRVLPPQSRFVFWGGVRYSFWDGVWYGPGPYGFVVVRPPFGIVIDTLPAFRTVVTLGGMPYYYANGIYYRERMEGGYEVVQPPVAGAGPGSPDRSYVYPRQAQSAQQQSTDEYECHRWAVGQSGFDPTAAAVGQPGAVQGQRGDYQRARVACLEGRGYTVR